MYNILHINSTGGISGILNDHRDKLNGVISYSAGHVYYVKKDSLSSKLACYYDGKPFSRLLKLLAYSLLERFDIIHIHSAEILVPYFKLFGKKVVLHYHGTDINLENRNKNIFRIICRSMANKILIADPKMKPRIIGNKNKIIYLPNIVDTSLFSNVHVRKNKKALCIISSNLDEEKIKNKISEYKIDVYYYNISTMGHINYQDMPKFLAQYEYYIDEKFTDFGLYLTALSTTALQALSLGVKVLHNSQEYTTLPTEHTPKYLIPKVENIYRDI